VIAFERDQRENPIGMPVADRELVPPPEVDIVGRLVRLEPLDAGVHTEGLFAAYEGHDHLWTYMPHGPFESPQELRTWIESKQHRPDPMFFAIIDQRTHHPVGIASYLRIDPGARSIEVGWITYSPTLQHSAGATEAMYLMMRQAFDLGYRRYEWKCNVLNEASIRAARRLGMTYEGTFRQATVVKGRNRDSAWFSLLDSEWPTARAAMEKWLSPGNFDEQGRQRTPLRIPIHGLTSAPSLS
jgi:RimJ/RimL family protein N-acetyltransferase